MFDKKNCTSWSGNRFLLSFIKGMLLKFLNYFEKRKRKRHHWTQEWDAFDHLKVAQEHHQEKIRVFNIIFMNVQCSDSCPSFGVPAICCYFITCRTSTVFRQLTFDSSNVPAIWKEKKNVLCLRWKITVSVTKKIAVTYRSTCKVIFCVQSPFIYTYHQIISGKDLTSTLTRGLRF